MKKANFKKDVIAKEELEKKKAEELNQDLPVGIWADYDTSISINSFKRLWKFNSIMSTKDNDYFEGYSTDGDLHEPSYDLSWGGTGTTDNATRRLPVLNGIDLTNKSPPSSPIMLGSQISVMDGEVRTIYLNDYYYYFLILTYIIHLIAVDHSKSVIS